MQWDVEMGSWRESQSLSHPLGYTLTLLSLALHVRTVLSFTLILLYLGVMNSLTNSTNVHGMLRITGTAFNPRDHSS